MTSKTLPDVAVRHDDTHWVISYAAMVSPCEILLRCEDESEAEQLASLALCETRRIESKFSRYRTDNIVHAINTSNGERIAVDEELARLLHFADNCYRLSDGMFDITSGILRKAWTFDGSAVTPDQRLINSLLDRVGWSKVRWDGQALKLRPEMEIDLGGIGKEYAADIVAEMLHAKTGRSLVVNFGGDIRAISTGGDSDPWVVGIEDPNAENHAVGQVEMRNGGIATSGDVHRFCYVDGDRLSHILDPRTGWPVKGSPRSLTVHGSCCVEAGFLATLAMLQGTGAEEFLRGQDVEGHCVR